MLLKTTEIKNCSKNFDFSNPREKINKSTKFVCYCWIIEEGKMPQIDQQQLKVEIEA